MNWSINPPFLRSTVQGFMYVQARFETAACVDLDPIQVQHQLIPFNHSPGGILILWRVKGCYFLHRWHHLDPCFRPVSSYLFRTIVRSTYHCQINPAKYKVLYFVLYFHTLPISELNLSGTTSVLWMAGSARLQSMMDETMLARIVGLA